MKRAGVGVLLVSLLAGSAAMAGPGHHWNDHRGWDRGHDRRVHHAPPPRAIYRPAPPRFGVYHAPRGYYAHAWRRGERLPVAYYAPRYVIADYRDCGLRAPPRGYHWVRVSNDAVLAAVATGVVLDVALHLFG
jgi:Ni/Co efflux regulator RcnB